jgi:hypothetical protein
MELDILDVVPSLFSDYLKSTAHSCSDADMLIACNKSQSTLIALTAEEVHQTDDVGTNHCIYENTCDMKTIVLGSIYGMQIYSNLLLQTDLS